MKKIVWLLLLLCITGASTGAAQVVDLQSQIDAAEEGSVIQLEKGVYEGNVIITKSIFLEGENGTVMKAHADTPAILIENASDVAVRGIDIETLGTGVTVRRSNEVKLSNINMRGVDTGVQVYNSQQLLISSLAIEGNAKHYAKKGNGIGIYNSASIELFENTINSVQDGFYIEGVQGITIHDNTVTNSRYGTHFMYSENGDIRHNMYTQNVTGLMVMMTEDIQVKQNDVSYQDGFNGTGITLYDTKNTLLQSNHIEGNRIGVSVQKTVDVELLENTFHMNQTALESVRSEESNTAMQNQFVGNLVNVRSDQQGLHLVNNYYDDYNGIDLDDNGTGDEAYVALQSFGQWMVRKPVYQYFIESPSVVLLNTIDKQTNTTSKVLLVDESPATMKNQGPTTSFQLQLPQLVIGLVLLIGCVVVYRRSVRI
ncbi:right-handed parallel beta-helix repeat-containing protein [Lysinibacillus sp. KU-BSD001]|uniref:right-handed parallel beta-helix repeat-containing protein n=1 Tax=Lysinibacillus sp. KU-BSD001 TaxID=3141328 RepID=UPI0036EFBED6